MPRQWTAKDAILAQQAQNTAPAINSPAPAPATALPVQNPIPSPTPEAPRVEWQWNYGTADNQVLAPTPAQTPANPATPVEKPKTASEAIAQGYKQEIKPVAKGVNAPLTTEIGREAKLGQLPTVQQAQNQAEQDRINTQNLKSASGQQLWSNLETISGANSSLLNDRNAFNKAFGYDGKDVSEKALVDAFWKSKRLDANSIYGAISTGATIPNESKNTPAFHDALIRHQDTTRFENLNPYLLSKVIWTELIPWTQTYNDLMAKNPQLVTDAQKLASINMPVTARQETKTNWQDAMSSYLARSPVMQNPTTVATIMNSDPNIATKTNEVQEVENKLTDAKDRLKKVQENVTARYKGTGATKQTINAKALAESQDIIDEITMLEANKASASSALTTLIQNAKDNYQMARQDRQDALDNYYKGFSQLQAMAKMGMDQDNEQYKRQQDATTRDLQLLMHYDEQDQANAREQRGYDFQMKRDEQNFGQQKELAKMGYQNQAYLSNLGFQQNMAQLAATQGFTSGQNATAQRNELIKTAMAQGQTAEQAAQSADIAMGTSGQQTQVWNLSGAELMKVLASGKLNGQKFFGVYATADMDGTDRANIYNKAENMGLDAFVNQYKGTKITPEMINIAAQKTGMDPLMIATVMAADSSMGTKWLGARNNNPWNVGQFDSLGTQWVAGYKTLQDGVNAVAENLEKRVNALIPKLPKSNQSVGQTTAASVQVEPAQYPSYVKYIESGVLPAGMKEWSAKAQQFQQQAQQWYIDAKNSTFKQQWFELSNPQAFASTTPKQREEINNAVMQVTPFTKTMDELIALTDKYGTENPYSAAWREMNQKVKNAQLIAKEIYNLWVLNWPDLSLMEAIIPRPTSFEANTIGVTQNYWDLLREAKKTILGNAISKAQSVWLSQIWTQWQSSATPVNQKAYDATKARLEQLKASRNK